MAADNVSQKFSLNKHLLKTKDLIQSSTKQSTTLIYPNVRSIDLITTCLLVNTRQLSVSCLYGWPKLSFRSHDLTRLQPTRLLVYRSSARLHVYPSTCLLVCPSTCLHAYPSSTRLPVYTSARLWSVLSSCDLFSHLIIYIRHKISQNFVFP